RARRLDRIGFQLISHFELLPENDATVFLFTGLGLYQHSVLGEYEVARPLFEIALMLSERVLGSEHHNTIMVLDNLGVTLDHLNDPKARSTLERALSLS